MADLSRVIFAVNMLAEKVSKAVGLSRRAALALGVMAIDPEIIDGKPVMTNGGLRRRLLEYNISTDLSVKKDGSVAKGELLDAGYVLTERKVSTFGITPSGREKVAEMARAMEAAINESGLAVEERGLLRRLVGLPPLNETAGTPHDHERARSVPKKPVGASKGARKKRRAS
jgi:hypothetical protein